MDNNFSQYIFDVANADFRCCICEFFYVANASFKCCMDCQMGDILIVRPDVSKFVKISLVRIIHLICKKAPFVKKEPFHRAHIEFSLRVHV